MEGNEVTIVVDPLIEAIPEFPLSTPISEVPAASYQGLDAHSDMASDYEWLSLRSWNPAAEVSLIDGAVVIGFHDYHDPRQRFFGFVGGNDPTRTAALLLECAVERGWLPELRLVPHDTAMRIGAGFDITADRDNFDYLFTPDDVINLRGPKHQLNRYQRGRFYRDHDRRFRINRHDAADAPWDAVVTITESWATKTMDRESAADEVKSVLRCCDTLELLPWTGDVLVTSMMIDGHVVGYDITEVRTGGWAVNHFQHSPHDRVGAHAAMRTAVAEWLIDRGVSWWNTEQDLGVEGLRTRKSRDRPAGFVRKYVVRRGQTAD